MARKRTLQRLIAVAGALLVLSLAGVAAAHPLGNFTISRYSALTLRQTAVDVLYIVDMAEIPTFQARQAMDADRDGTVTPAEQEDWVTSLVPQLSANLLLAVDGDVVALESTGHALSFPPGQGDLETTRLEITLTAALPPVAAGEARQLTYEDGNFTDRLGWQEVVAGAADGSLLESSVPTTDLSHQLRDYPADLLQTPPRVHSATISHAPTAAGMAVPVKAETATQAAAVSADRFSTDEFANLLGRTLDTPGALLAALLVAVGLGAAHALTPGHGKTIVGAYLVGSRGTARHALFLGLTTTITHTAGVFALGFLVLAASEFILPEQLYPWLGVLSGLLVVFIGASIFRGHFRHWLARRRGAAAQDENFHYHFGKGHSHASVEAATEPAAPARPAGTLAFAGLASGSTTMVAPARGHAHDHDHAHEHPHDHPHPHGDHDHPHDAHEHPHPADANDSLSWRNLLALGISGGLLPCPSALILMLSAIALRQVGLGIVLIIAFSIGLAGVLTSIGLIMVYAGKFLERLPIRHTSVTARLLPAASAAFITVAGVLITWRALIEAGVL
ncbi:MAG: hypothetical protein KIS95_11380 [Anaerolineae bacterium]|uniref:nickel/cobalt transporter n=1 Tax=Promineifilum sp. TaxID=2664178 RepID=UPI001D3F991E|nr:hypothetical protein [Anaerolineales bacterium]MCB8936098.1 hypothetical protein [Promineifilum sp.]MCO5182289.1 hypothetical protein [Promineifilum sp.]MCW5847825.1 hypothetical protein [Anaerolineae bacterium]